VARSATCLFMSLRYGKGVGRDDRHECQRSAPRFTGAEIQLPLAAVKHRARIGNGRYPVAAVGARTCEPSKNTCPLQARRDAAAGSVRVPPRIRAETPITCSLRGHITRERGAPMNRGLLPPRGRSPLCDLRMDSGDLKKLDRSSLSNEAYRATFMRRAGFPRRDRAWCNATPDGYRLPDLEAEEEMWNRDRRQGHAGV